MANLISKSVTSLAAFALGAVMTVTAAKAQQGTRTVTGERYAPTIWVDPDGCEHWVMDDGFEGYMSPHTTRQGIPVCHRGNVCGVMNSDQFFATNSHRISAYGKPVCSGIAPPNTAIGPYKGDQTINDPL